jgi:GH35 family endo-1,4-beta-xylanase
MKNQRVRLIYLLFISVLCVNHPLTLVAGGKKTTPIADKDLTIRQIIDKYYSKSNFYFGCISKASYTDPGNPDAAIYLKEFSYNTPENEFKQRVVYPEPNAEWHDEDYRKLIEMARQNKQVMRAHSPISPQCSKWAMEDNRTPEELKSVMIHYMTNISKEIEANSDVLKWMDVVNETVATSKMDDTTYHYKAGDWFGPLLGTERWQNPWLIIGQETKTQLKVPTYIQLAFEIANLNAPHIKLLYNHNGGMEQEAWDKVKETVLYLRNKGLRVDALGWQAHVPCGFEKVEGNMDKLNKLIDWCYQNKLEFHVTELDVKMGKNIEPSVYIEKANEIADTYGAITETLLKKIGKGAVGINCWSMKHRTRKNEGCFAGLFDDQLKPTLAYFRIKEKLLKYATGNK